MDKTDDSPGVAAQRFYVDYPPGTRAHLDALVFIRIQVELVVTDRTSKSRLFHIDPTGEAVWERPRLTTAGSQLRPIGKGLVSSGRGLLVCPQHASLSIVASL